MGILPRCAGAQRGSRVLRLGGVTVEELLALNPLDNPDIVPLGQALRLPSDAPSALVGPALKLIPDSELVYGPAARDFDVRGFAAPLGGYLTGYSEEVEGQLLDGPAIVDLIAQRYSINPRLLLAVLEHQSGWLTLDAPAAVDLRNVRRVVYDIVSSFWFEACGASAMSTTENHVRCQDNRWVMHRETCGVGSRGRTPRSVLMTKAG